MNRVAFRDFEERDIDFIYRCKNDAKLNSLIVGQFRPFTYEEATNWVHGCMGEYENYKFWAICENDENKKIVGWVSLSQIDKINRSACFHGIVIGDDNYKDGIAWIETYLFVLEFVFERLNLNRFSDTCIVEHRQSNKIGEVMFFQKEGILRDAVFKNGRYYDLTQMSILSKEYFHHKNQGDYEFKSIIRRFRL